MEENKQHFQHIILYYLKKGKNTNEVQKRLEEYIWRRFSESLIMSKGSQFHAGDFSLDDAP